MTSVLDDEAGKQTHVVDGARLLAGVGATVYALMAAALLAGPDGHMRWLAGYVSLTAVGLGAAWLGLRRRQIDAVQRSTRGSLMALGLLIISNPVAFMVAEETAHPSIGMTVVIVATGGLVHDTRLALALVGVANAAWLGVAAAFGIGEVVGRGTFVGELAMINVVAALLHVTRARTVRRLESARREVARIAVTDALTGVGNQRQIDEVGPELHRRAREGGLLSVIFIDVDELKVVNDRFGHAAGDRLIQSVADVLKRTVREHDLVARVGGDEFVVLCTGLDEAGASALTERMRRELGHHGHSVSVGIASATGAADERIQDVIARADQAMYADKITRRTAGSGSQALVDG